MAEVGTYYITIMPDMSKFTGGVNAALGGVGATGGKEYSKSFAAALKGSALGVALGNMAMTAGRYIAGGLQTGIGRLDTIKNFPKVMQALGFESGEAEKSIQLVMDRLDGLPTATQDVVAMTQAFADSTGDLDLATRAALGFNDMMLASGASVGEVTQAQGVLNRVLGKGSATVAQWQSLQSVMPAQLAAVARELGGEGMSVEELREALNEGTISWDEFLQAVVKLDQEGSGAMASFYDQAKANSVGIGTALANVQNRIGAGWASILDAIGQESISGAIDKASYGVRDAMERIAGAITYVSDLVAKTSIGENLQRVGQAIGEGLSAIWQDGGPEMAKALADALVGLIDGALQWLADNGDVVKAAVGGIAGALAAIIGLDIGAKLAALPGIFTAITTALAANPFGIVVTAIAAVVMALITFFRYTETGKAIWQGFCDGLKALWEGLKADFQTAVEMIGQRMEESAAQWEVFKSNVKAAVDGVKDAVAKVAKKVTDTLDKIKQGLVKTFNAIKSALNTAKGAWKSFWDSVKAAVDNAKAAVGNAMNAIKSTVTKVSNTLKSIVSSVCGAIGRTVSTAVNTAKTTVQTAWNNITSATRNAWNNIKSAVSNAINGAKSTVQSVANAIRSAVSNAFNSARSAASSAFSGIRSTVTTAINAAKNAVSTAVSAIKSLIANCKPKFPSIKAPDFGSIKSAVSNAIANIKAKLSGANLSLPKIRFPHIPLPHFTVTDGQFPWGIGGKGSMPKFHVSWYAKGGVFDNPAIIGVGESGTEAVLPLNAGVYRQIARGIMAEGGAVEGVTITGNTFYVREEADIDRIAGALARKIRREGGALA